MAERRKQKGSVIRSEVFGLRLDPKMRYIAELAARKQRRSLASYVEWAIEQSLKAILVDANEFENLYDSSEALWDLREPDRLVKLAIKYPSLLTYEEQLIWDVIKSYGIPALNEGEKTWMTFKFPISPSENPYNLILVRKCWNAIRCYALEQDKEELDAAITKYFYETTGMDYQVKNNDKKTHPAKST